VLVDSNVVINKESGDVEGAHGAARVQRPLVTSRTAWAWSSSTTFSNQIRRRYSNAAVATFEPGGVPWSWRERVFQQEGKITRSFGWETKNDVSVGASLGHARYVVPSDGLDPRAVEAFRREAVPTGEDRVGPFVQWHGYSSDFLRTFDLDTLGLQEDQRLGHDLWARVYPVTRALGSTRDFVGTHAGASYGVPIGDGVARASIEATTEATADAISDASVRGGIGVATPTFGFARLVLSATALSRYRNYLNARSFVGGNNVLRGYPTRHVAGKDLAAANAELRTRSIDLGSVLVAVVAFYDVADAFDGFDRADPKRSVGGGLRLVFPQIDRAVLRFDAGVPLGDVASDVPPVSIFMAFHQAISLPVVGSGMGP
jgi:hypothetical protein